MRVKAEATKCVDAKRHRSNGLEKIQYVTGAMMAQGLQR